MREMVVTIKLKLDTDADSDILLNNTMSAYRQACNYVSDYIFETHCLNTNDIQKNIYYDIKNRFNLKAQMAISCIRTVVARYKTILETQHEWIKAEFKKPQYDLVWNRDYSLVSGCFSVNTLNGRLKFSYHADNFGKYFNKDIYSFGTAKLVYKHSKYFLHIPVLFEIPNEDLSKISNVVGIDRGINFIVSTYDSKHKTGFVSGRFIKQKRAKFKTIRQKLQRIRTSSSRRRLKAIGQRENRWMQDVNHQVSKALVESNPEHTLFVLEDLTGIRKVSEKVRLKDRYVSVSWAFYDLEQKLKYKASLHNCSVINVNPAYTSQACPCCGHTEKANRNKKIHLFACKNCGYRSNDDRVAAMNLYRMGIEYLVPDTVTAE
ncbi:MAG: transposase [Oscillospiraceae bacterium]|nr:transposase [Oscillospiraceae bacterium]